MSRRSAPPPASAPESAGPFDSSPARLFLIQEVAAKTGLTPRSIRYYEEVGLLRPAGRSRGAYRLYDVSDVERLRFIRDLRDDAGFSLAEIGLLLEDEEARIRTQERFRDAGDTAEKQIILRDLVSRVDRQVASLEAKAKRLRAMIAAAKARRANLGAHLAELEGGRPAHGTGTPHPETGP